MSEKRVIKFRAWDNIGKVMVDWGTICQTAFNRNGEYGLMYKVMTCGRHGGDLTPMQFTGLHDKNGNEIYEGDILKLICDCGQEEITEVYFDDGAFLVEANFGEFDLHPIGWAIYHWNSSSTDFSIIGNIYESPELLK